MKRFADGAARAVRPGSALAAVVLGASAAVFASGYWLIDLFPGGGKRLLLGTVLVGMAAAAGYCVAMEFLHRALARLGLWKAVLLILASAPLALLFFFAGTSQWQLENRYFVFLLPRHEFRIEAVGATEGASISWISTSVGDVSYESADLQGWNRDGTLIVLQTPTANSVEWRASPGGRLVVVIDSPRSQGNIQLAWDGQKDVIQLAAGKTVYERAFQVPYFASRAWIIVLGLANFWVLSLLLVIGLREFPSALMPKDLPDGDSSSGSGRRREILAVAAIMSVALLLRGLNLGRLFPAVDEYYHLIAADQLVRGVPPAAVYPRGLWIVTLPVAGAISIFGHEVWAARAAGAAFNAMAIIPLYLVTRRISRPVGITACLLFATSPWIMAFGRMAREYAYYPFYFYWIILAMLTLIETFPRGFIVREH